MPPTSGAVRDRFAPHNLYSSLRQPAEAVGGGRGRARADEGQVEVRPGHPLEQRPEGGSITVSYPANTITYRYNRKANTYRRSVSVEGTQTRRVERQADRAEERDRDARQFLARSTTARARTARRPTSSASGKAWIATNGRTIKGTWRKNKITGPTKFFDADGKEVTLTVGQTFVQVLDIGSKVTIKKGKEPPAVRPPRRALHVADAGSGVGADLRVDPPGRGGDLGPRPPPGRPRARLTGDPRVDPPVGPDGLQRGCQPSRLARRDEDAGRPDELRERADRRRHDGGPAGERVDGGETGRL